MTNKTTLNKIYTVDFFDKKNSFIRTSYYDDEVKKVVVRRKSFGLSSIKDDAARKAKGEQLVDQLTKWLSLGQHYKLFSEEALKELLEKEQGNPPKEVKQEKKKKKKSKRKKYRKYPHINTPILQAMEKARELKCNFERYNTNKSYSSHINRFTEWLLIQGYGDLTCKEMSHFIAYEYLDYYQFTLERRKTTVNNVFIHNRAIWFALKKRGYCKINPFTEWDPLREEKKLRRKFNKEEAVAVLEKVYKTDKVLFFAIIMQYGCLVRPAEMRRLRLFDIHLDQGLIIIPSDAAKNWRERVVTIPAFLLPYFDHPFWESYEKDCYLFGPKGIPNKYKSCGRDMLYKRHRKVLIELHEKGVLSNIVGLQFYSWKDTGITDVINQLGLMTAMNHAGHKDYSTTLRYYDKNRINKRMLGMEDQYLGDSAP